MFVLMIAKTYLGRGQTKTRMWAVKGYPVYTNYDIIQSGLYQWVEENISKDAYEIVEAMKNDGWWCEQDDAIFTYCVGELEMVQ